MAALVLTVATGLGAGPEIDVSHQVEAPAVWMQTADLPAWTVPVGVGCVLLALTTTWMTRRDRHAGLGTVVSAVAAAAIFVAVSHRSSTLMANVINAALEEAAQAVCPHAGAVIVYRIQSSLATPDLRVRGARAPSSRFVVADLQGKGHEGDDDIGVWLIDESNSGSQDPAQPIYAVNALAAVSDFPHKPVDTQTSKQFNACIRVVQREVSGT